MGFSLAGDCDVGLAEESKKVGHKSPSQRFASGTENIHSRVDVAIMDRFTNSAGSLTGLKLCDSLQ